MGALEKMQLYTCIPLSVPIHTCFSEVQLHADADSGIEIGNRKKKKKLILATGGLPESIVTEL